MILLDTQIYTRGHEVQNENVVADSDDLKLHIDINVYHFYATAISRMKSY